MTKFDVGLLKKEISKKFLSYFLYPATVWKWDEKRFDSYGSEYDYVIKRI